MNDFDRFMNTPGHSIYPPTDINIIEEYKRRLDVKTVAKVFDIAQSDVRQVLKQAGIIIKKKNESKTELSNLGMSEKDFYHD